MQALILAAGFGRRLQPITNKIPKSLVEVNGIPLLINALECLSDRDITEVLIVVGDKKDIIINKIGHSYNEMKITYIENPIYKKTNNVYSLWLAQNYVHDDLIMLECDLFYHRTLIDHVLSKQNSCNILVSPFDINTMDGTVISSTSDNKVISLTIKRDQGENFDYTNMMKTVNIYFYKKDFIMNKFFPAIDNYVKTQSSNSYYELVLGSLIYYGNDDIYATEIPASEWSEIDDIEDLRRAERKFN